MVLQIIDHRHGPCAEDTRLCRRGARVVLTDRYAARHGLRSCKGLVGMLGRRGSHVGMWEVTFPGFHHSHSVHVGKDGVFGLMYAERVRGTRFSQTCAPRRWERELKTIGRYDLLAVPCCCLPLRSRRFHDCEPSARMCMSGGVPPLTFVHLGASARQAHRHTPPVLPRARDPKRLAHLATRPAPGRRLLNGGGRGVDDKEVNLCPREDPGVSEGQGAGGCRGQA